MNMKDLGVSVVFGVIVTAVVFAFANFVGDVAMQPRDHMPERAALEAAKAASAPAQEDTMPSADVPPAVKSSASDETTAPEAAAVVAAAETVTGDAAKGTRTFKSKCGGCHTYEEGDRNRTGPNLWGVIGRERGAVEGFRYSTAMKESGGVWTPENLSAFIENPRSNMPGTKMTYKGLGKPQDRANVVAYILTLR